MLRVLKLTPRQGTPIRVHKRPPDSSSMLNIVIIIVVAQAAADDPDRLPEARRGPACLGRQGERTVGFTMVYAQSPS